MKIKINISKLTDSPYSAKFKDFFLFEDNDVIDQLIQALKCGYPSSYLISGYRGAGKTSLINKVKELLSENTIYVNLSLAKYDGYSILLKKLIRQLYLGFIENKIYTDKKLENDKIITEFSILYERTFSEITQTSKNESKNDQKKSNEITFDLKSAIPFILILLSGTNLAFNILQYPYINYFLFILVSIWAAISAWKINLTHTKNKTETDELLRKTLYDNEIAEHHLFQILSKLKELNLNVIIVFDELDKIDSLDEIQKVIHELKSLLLSGLANFVVISGQGLYYQLEKSQLIDDPIISSLFSKTIHVPFLHYSSLKKYCLNLVDDNAQKKEQLFNDYFDTLILKSSRVPRKLSNIIRNKIHWEDNSAFLIVDDENKKFYEFESTLISIINKIIDGDLPKITEDKVLIDFFIAQIHLWLYKIKFFRGIPTMFTIPETIEITTYDENEYPRSYINQLSALCELLFNRLIEQNLLDNFTNSPDEIGRYGWVDETTTINESSEETVIANEKPSDFISQFIDLEIYVRNIYIDVINEADLKNTNLSLRQMYNELIKLGVFSVKRNESNRIIILTELRNKISHDKPLTQEELDLIQKAQFEIGILKGELISDYTFFVSKKYLKKYQVIKDGKSGFDFVANNNTESIIFEVKYLQSGRPDSRAIKEVVDKFSNFKQITSRDIYYVLFFYQPNGKKAFDDFKKSFYNLVNKTLSKEISDKFFLFYTSEYRGDASTGRIELYLQQVLNKINEQNNKSL